MRFDLLIVIVVSLVSHCDGANGELVMLPEAREVIEARLIMSDYAVDKKVRLCIYELGGSKLPEDGRLLAKCLVFHSDIFSGSFTLINETENLHFPARRYCLSEKHSAAFIAEFHSSGSLKYKLLIAREMLSSLNGAHPSKYLKHSKAEHEPGIAIGGGKSDLDEFIYILTQSWRKVDLRSVYSINGDYPTDAQSRAVLHANFPDWRWLRDNVPKPSEQEVEAYLQSVIGTVPGPPKSSPAASSQPPSSAHLSSEQEKRYTWQLWVGFLLLFSIVIGFVFKRKSG